MPVLGGALIDRFSWHACFGINLPLCLLLIIFYLHLSRGSHPQPELRSATNPKTSNDRSAWDPHHRAMRYLLVNRPAIWEYSLRMDQRPYHRLVCSFSPACSIVLGRQGIDPGSHNQEAKYPCSFLVLSVLQWHCSNDRVLHFRLLAMRSKRDNTQVWPSDFGLDHWICSPDLCCQVLGIPKVGYFTRELTPHFLDFATKRKTNE